MEVGHPQPSSLQHLPELVFALNTVPEEAGPGRAAPPSQASPPVPVQSPDRALPVSPACGQEPAPHTASWQGQHSTLDLTHTGKPQPAREIQTISSHHSAIQAYLLRSYPGKAPVRAPPNSEGLGEAHLGAVPGYGAPQAHHCRQGFTPVCAPLASNLSLFKDFKELGETLSPLHGGGN